MEVTPSFRRMSPQKCRSGRTRRIDRGGIWRFLSCAARPDETDQFSEDEDMHWRSQKAGLRRQRLRNFSLIGGQTKSSRRSERIRKRPSNSGSTDGRTVDGSPSSWSSKADEKRSRPHRHRPHRRHRRRRHNQKCSVTSDGDNATREKTLLNDALAKTMEQRRKPPRLLVAMLEDGAGDMRLQTTRDERKIRHLLHKIRASMDASDNLLPESDTQEIPNSASQKYSQRPKVLSASTASRTRTHFTAPTSHTMTLVPSPRERRQPPSQPYIHQPPPPQSLMQQPQPPQSPIQQLQPPQSLMQQSQPLQLLMQQSQPLQSLMQQPHPPQSLMQQPHPPQSLMQQPHPPQSLMQQPHPPQSLMQQPHPPQSLMQQPPHPQLQALQPPPPPPHLPVTIPLPPILPPYLSPVQSALSGMPWSTHGAMQPPQTTPMRNAAQRALAAQVSTQQSAPHPQNLQSAQQSSIGVNPRSERPLIETTLRSNGRRGYRLFRRVFSAADNYYAVPFPPLETLRLSKDDDQWEDLEIYVASHKGMESIKPKPKAIQSGQATVSAAVTRRRHSNLGPIQQAIAANMKVSSQTASTPALSGNDAKLFVHRQGQNLETPEQQPRALQATPTPASPLERAGRVRAGFLATPKAQQRQQQQPSKPQPHPQLQPQQYHQQQQQQYQQKRADPLNPSRLLSQLGGPELPSVGNAATRAAAPPRAAYRPWEPPVTPPNRIARYGNLNSRLPSGW